MQLTNCQFFIPPKMSSGSINQPQADDHLQPLQVPIIDLSLLRKNSPTKSLIIQQLHQACQNLGFFHVINHGIPESVMQGALDVNSEFFGMPKEIKEELMFSDIYKPVRFGTLGGGEGGCQFLRDFLKLYAHPFHHFVDLWPKNPPNYREKMGIYTTEVRKLGIKIFGAIMMSLGLEEICLEENFEQGMHIMGVNSYPPSSQSNIKMGIAAHSDHSIITILLQSHPGLHVMDRADATWKAAPELKGSLQVLVGDHLEVLSNGLYKSVFHRAIPSSEKTRLSLASLHSLGMDEIVEPAMKLVDEKHPKGYKGSSLKDFLMHLSSRQEKRFIETLKI